MLIYKLLNKDTDIVTEAEPIIIFDMNYAVCITNNGKDIKRTRHIDRGVHFMRNGEIFKMHNSNSVKEVCSLYQKYVGETDLNPRMKYHLGSIDN